jgi:hypothetical protein
MAKTRKQQAAIAMSMKAAGKAPKKAQYGGADDNKAYLYTKTKSSGRDVTKKISPSRYARMQSRFEGQGQRPTTMTNSKTGNMAKSTIENRKGNKTIQYYDKPEYRSMKSTYSKKTGGSVKAKSSKKK